MIREDKWCKNKQIKYDFSNCIIRDSVTRRNIYGEILYCCVINPNIFHFQRFKIDFKYGVNLNDSGDFE